MPRTYIASTGMYFMPNKSNSQVYTLRWNTFLKKINPTHSPDFTKAMVNINAIKGETLGRHLFSNFFPASFMISGWNRSF